jgi:mono/diheme cytochrome c family protein
VRYILRALRAAVPKAAPVLFIALGVGLAAPPASATDQQIALGEAAYAADCASCHRTPARFMRRYLDIPPPERAATLERFLPDHYAPDAGRRAAIIAWLMTHRSR